MTESMESGLITQEAPVPGVNEEFNQYMEYYMQLIRMKSEGNVLIVEDDVDCRLFIENAIRKFSSKICCLTAASEQQALKILNLIPCDLIIADYFLDGPGTGLDLCRKVHSRFPDAKCLMISGMTFYKYKDLALKSEVQPDFMEKPLSPGSIEKYLASFFEKIDFSNRDNSGRADH